MGKVKRNLVAYSAKPVLGSSILGGLLLVAIRSTPMLNQITSAFTRYGCISNSNAVYMLSLYPNIDIAYS